MLVQGICERNSANSAAEAQGTPGRRWTSLDAKNGVPLTAAPHTTPQHAYRKWRAEELQWLLLLRRRVESLMPSDAVVANPADTPERSPSSSPPRDDDEAHMTHSLDRVARRLQWMSALDMHPGDDALCTSSWTSDADRSNWASSSILVEDSDVLAADSSTRPESGTLLRVSSLKRMFHDFLVLRDSGDDAAACCVADVVLRMLTLRKPKLLRCLLSRFLDDVVEVLQMRHPQLASRRRSSSAINAVLEFAQERLGQCSPPTPQQSGRLNALRRLVHHKNVIDDIVDAIVAPCDDATFCGLLELREQLAVLVSTQLVHCDIVAATCDAIRHYSAKDDADEMVLSLWRSLHASVSAMAEFIDGYVAGDEPDDATDGASPNNETEESSGQRCGIARMDDGWRHVLSDAAEGSKLLGLICSTLLTAASSGAATKMVDVRRIAASILRRLTDDGATVGMLVGVLKEFHQGWEYLLPSLVDVDLCVRCEVVDALTAIIKCDDDNTSATIADQATPPATVASQHSIRQLLVKRYSRHLLAAVDVALSMDLDGGGAAASSPSCAQVLQFIGSCLVDVPSWGGAAAAPLAPRGTNNTEASIPKHNSKMLDEYTLFHSELLRLVVLRLESLSGQGKERHMSAQRRSVACCLLQYLRLLISSHKRPTAAPSCVSRRLFPTATTHRVVLAVSHLMELRGCRGVLLGACCELLTALKQT